MILLVDENENINQIYQSYCGLAMDTKVQQKSTKWIFLSLRDTADEKVSLISVRIFITRGCREQRKILH